MKLVQLKDHNNQNIAPINPYYENRLNNIETYSTTETIIGKDYDGKNIYRKVFVDIPIQIGVGNNFESGLRDVKDVMITGIVKYGVQNITINSYFSNTIFISAAYDYVSNLVYYDCASIRGTGKFILTYKKTTD